MNELPAAYSRTGRVYRWLLRFYPLSFQRDYGAAMIQLFEDQCRDLDRAWGSRGVWAAWRWLLQDIFLSVTREHVTNLETQMKAICTHRLNHLLFGAAVIFALLANPAFAGSVLAIAFLYLSTVAILARAIAEWFRPQNQWLKGAGWGVVVMVAFGFILPFWAKLHALHGSAFPVLPALHAGAALLNLVVPLLKGLMGSGRLRAS
jgi:hypothetical protein